MLKVIEAFSSERPEAEPIPTWINPELIASVRPRASTRRDTQGHQTTSTDEDLIIVSMAGDRSGSGWLVKSSVENFLERMGISARMEFARAS